MPFPQKGAALAPMRALTQPPFWRILNRYGAPDAYFSEFVRVHEHYTIESGWIEEALDAAGPHPLWIQLMGNDLRALETNVRVLERYPIAGIDFNAGCPVPKIFKKQAGGGLLRDLPLLRTLVLGLRSICTKPLSLKFRLGFDSPLFLDKILEIINEAQMALATLHARTVKDLYKATPRFQFVTHAVQRCHCPLLANGSIDSLEDIAQVLKTTHSHGVMLGRVAIRNPWIFAQWRNFCQSKAIKLPRFSDVYQYLEDLFHSFQLEKKEELTALGCMKRFSNYIGLSIEADGQFLQQIRITHSLKDFWNCCRKFLLTTPDKPYSGHAFKHLLAQPNKEL